MQLARLGAEIVAFDATLRPRPHPVHELVAAVHGAGALVMADISTLAEALAALADGADIVSTTLSGYTPDSPAQPGPDWALMDALKAAGVPYAAEGRIQRPEAAAEALTRGAAFVVVGSAIVELVGRHGPDAPAAVRAYVATLRTAIDATVKELA